MAESERKLKALHLVKTSSGAAWALRQMRELVRLGVEIHAALPPGGPLFDRYRSAGVVVHPSQFDFPVKRPFSLPAIFRELRALVSRVRPDIIHSHFVGTTLTMRLALGRGHEVPRVFQVPGPLHLEHRLFRDADILTAGRQDHWIGSCRWTCERYIKSNIPPGRVHLSYYGTDIENFRSVRTGKLRKELATDANAKIVGMVAYMYAPKRYLGQRRGIKGHEDLIDAMALCLEKNPDLLCGIVGGAWNKAYGYERSVMNYARKRCGEKVVFLGSRSDVAEIYPDFDLAVHPSHSENVGGAVESLLSGVPTIATDTGGFPDLVKHGVTGWLVPPGKPRMLAGAIIEALKDAERSREMALRGQALARRLFDVKETARQILEIYYAILSGRKP